MPAADNKKNKLNSKRKRLEEEEEERDDAVANSSSSEDESSSSSAWAMNSNNNNNKQKPSSNQFADDFKDLNLSDEEELDDEEEEGDEDGEGEIAAGSDDSDSEDGYEAEAESLHGSKSTKKKNMSKKRSETTKNENAEAADEEEEDDVYVSDDEYGFLEGDEEEEDAGFDNYDDDSDDDGVHVLETFDNTTDDKNNDKKQPSLFDDVDYSDDSSEDEGMINTIGNVPLEWYEEYDHIGYDRDGNKILRKKRRDALDNLLARHDDPNYIRTVYDELNDKEHVINNKDLQTIIDIQKGRFPPGFNPYKDYVDYVKVDSRFPIVGVPDPKSRYTPNRMEQNNIAKLAQRMRKNPKVGVPQPPKRQSQCYLMWGPDGALIGDKVPRVGLIQAPKTRLPGHTFSYNPPPEYIRNDSFTPRYDALRKVPAFSKFVEEQYKRCLDLYMAPRTLPKRKAQDPQRLLPELPKPEELRPYPEIPSVMYEGHGDVVKKVAVDPTGRWLVTGSDDFAVRLYEAKTGRLVYTWQFEDSINWVEWNPNAQLNLLAVAVQKYVYIIQPTMTGTEKSNEATKDLFPATAYTEDISLFADEGEEQQQERKESTEEDSTKQNNKEDSDSDDQNEQDIHAKSKTGRKKVLLKWRFYREEEEKEKRSQGILVRLEHLKGVSQVTWHYRGDYFCSLSPDAYNDGIVIHQLSKRQSQKPFKKRMKNKGQKIVRVLFHPKLPQFFVSTQVGVKVYNLQKQRLYKKFKGQRCRYISSLAVHPTGGHVLTGGFDKRAEWFDMELSSRPYKTLRYHNKSVRSVCFHPRYPLFATSSDDGTIHVFHCSVYDDWLKDPLIVPLKVLRGHRVVNHLGVLDLQFHPTQPWLFSCGADQTARLWIS